VDFHRFVVQEHGRKWFNGTTNERLHFFRDIGIVVIRDLKDAIFWFNLEHD
jgi:hypothetical protein